MDKKSEISIKLKKINNICEQYANRELESLGITNTQLHILIYLVSNNKRDIYQKEIEQVFNLKNPTVTGVLNRLEEKNFIIRKTNSNDARYKKIITTEKTLGITADMKRNLKEMKNKLMYGLSENEICILNDLLEKMLRNLSATGNNKEEEKEC